MQRVSGKAQLASLALVIVGILGSAAYGQVQVPRYQSPIEAPKPQTPTLPAPTAITPDATVVEFPLARVNDQIIDNSDYMRAQRDLAAEAQRDNATPDEIAERQKNLLRDMIDQQLLLSRAKELDINVDSEVIRLLDDIRKQNHLDSMEDLEKAVRESGISYEDFKQSRKDQLLTTQVVRDEVGRKLTMTAKQEQAYYDQHKQEYAQPESVHLSEILIPTPADATDAQVAQAQTKADEVAAKLKAGATFEDLAKQYSAGETAASGGDLGDFKRGTMAQVLEDQTFKLKPGETTTPIRTKSGFVLLKVSSHTAAGIPPLSAVDGQVQEAMYEEAMKPALRTYLTDLREKAYIDIAPGYVDTGASPKETKPVYASATPLPTKKKTQKERLDQGKPTAAPATKDATTTPATRPAAAASAEVATVATGKKPKKVHREKIRYGQAPRNSLPSAPEETLAPGADQGEGATPSAAQAPGAAIESADNTTPLGAEIDNSTSPNAAATGKTRYSARAPIEAKARADAKIAKVKQKAALTPPPVTVEQKATQQQQDAPLGLNGDTASKKKHKRVKGEAKERIQTAPPAPAAPKPTETPIPPKSVRDNGEPAVTPPPSNLPPVTPPSQ